MTTVERVAPRLKQRYLDEIKGELRDKRFMKIISLAPEVL